MSDAGASCVSLSVSWRRAAVAGRPDRRRRSLDRTEGGGRASPARAGGLAKKRRRSPTPLRPSRKSYARGGRLLLFGNGGSATDATDWALDCVSPPPGWLPVPALSLAAEPATITAIANDVGREFIFLRQLIAHVRERDVVDRAVDQRRLAQRHRGAGRGAQARKPYGRASGIRRRRDFPRGVLPIMRSSCAPTTFPASKRRKPRSITRCAARSDGLPMRELFATKTCPYCSQVREQLEWDALDFVEYDVDADEAARARLQELVGANPMVPVLVEEGRVSQVGVAGRGCYVGNG